MFSLILAQAKKTIQGRLTDVGGAAGLTSGQTDITVIAGKLIRGVIVLMGTVFFAQMVYAGYLWMTARGEEDQVTRAKDTIQRNLLGFVIMLAAYAIASYVVAKLTAATVG